MSVETTHTVKWVLRESRWILCESKWISRETSSGVHGMVVQMNIATCGDSEKAFHIWKDYLYIPTGCPGMPRDAQGHPRDIWEHPRDIQGHSRDIQGHPRDTVLSSGCIGFGGFLWGACGA